MLILVFGKYDQVGQILRFFRDADDKKIPLFKDNEAAPPTPVKRNRLCKSRYCSRRYFGTSLDIEGNARNNVDIEGNTTGKGTLAVRRWYWLGAVTALVLLILKAPYCCYI